MTETDLYILDIFNLCGINVGELNIDKKNYQVWIIM